LAFVEGCKHSLEITIPVDAVDQETAKAVESFQKRARIPGFRPGKAPASLIRKHFEGDIRQQVFENLVPRFLDEQIKQENLQPVARPDIVDVHFHAGEPIRFKAEFEVSPVIELADYRGLKVEYADPEISDADVAERVDQIRDSKSTFANEEPRPLVNGDHAVISLESIAGTEEPVKTDEITIEVGGKDTLEGFSENLRGMSPEEEKDFDVTYPEDYGQDKLAGKTVRFHCTVKGVRRKELPELNDEFAQDLGDYRSVDELRDAVRKSIFTIRQGEAQEAAKNKLVDTLVDAHEFPVPTVFVEHQIRQRLEQSLRGLADQGVDPESLKLDWEKIKETQRERATRAVKASLLLDAVSRKESIFATNEEVDKEVERLARQQREPVLSLRPKLEKDGTMGRIASHIQTSKTLQFLFDNAEKTLAA
jgi:trigger factor